MNINGHDIGVCSWSLHPKDMTELIPRLWLWPNMRPPAATVSSISASIVSALDAATPKVVRTRLCRASSRRRPADSRR